MKPRRMQTFVVPRCRFLTSSSTLFTFNLRVKIKLRIFSIKKIYILLSNFHTIFTLNRASSTCSTCKSSESNWTSSLIWSCLYSESRVFASSSSSLCSGPTSHEGDEGWRKIRERENLRRRMEKCGDMEKSTTSALCLHLSRLFFGSSSSGLQRRIFRLKKSRESKLITRICSSCFPRAWHDCGVVDSRDVKNDVYQNATRSERGAATRRQFENHSSCRRANLNIEN